MYFCENTQKRPNDSMTGKEYKLESTFNKYDFNHLTRISFRYFLS